MIMSVHEVTRNIEGSGANTLDGAYACSLKRGRDLEVVSVMILNCDQKNTTQDDNVWEKPGEATTLENVALTVCLWCIKIRDAVVVRCLVMWSHGHVKCSQCAYVITLGRRVRQS